MDKWRRIKVSYIHINNLYLDKTIFMFRECYALEKVHGGTAHIACSDQNGIELYCGALDSREAFLKVLVEDHGASPNSIIDLLCRRFLKVFPDLCAPQWVDPQEVKNPPNPKQSIVIHGEVYGGKIQQMGEVYGKKQQFIVFDVRINNSWLSVPDAQDVATKLGFRFVPYVKGPVTEEFLDTQRDSPSIVAIENGMGDTHQREGIVIRPLIELRKNNGERILAKHKHAKFMETRTPRPTNPEKLEVLAAANAIAEEWVTPMRLIHVLAKVSNPSIKDTGTVIKLMLEDVLREGSKEIIDSKDARKAIGSKTVELFRKYISDASLQG
jgi:hypothetical protein